MYICIYKNDNDMKTTANTYETINLLRATAGVTVGNYEYDGAAYSGKNT